MSPPPTADETCTGILACRSFFSSWLPLGDLAPTPCDKEQQLCGGMCKASDDPEYRFAIASQSFQCEGSGKGREHNWYLRLGAMVPADPILFGLATGNHMTDLHHRISGGLQHLVTQDMLLLSLKVPAPTTPFEYSNDGSPRASRCPCLLRLLLPVGGGSDRGSVSRLASPSTLGRLGPS